MPLPVPNLDDRRFDDLVAEAQQRLSRHLPELTRLAPGDPVHNFIDLFAWLTETILFRANLVPERQRRVFLNLLQLPLRAARPARGLVCIDAGPRTLRLPAFVADGTQVQGKGQTFSTLGEVQPTPLELHVAIKERLDTASLQEIGLTLQSLHEQHKLKSTDVPAPFQPRSFVLGKETLSLGDSLDAAYYLALVVPKPLLPEISELRRNLAGILLNIGIAPADEVEGEQISELRPRELSWELLSQDADSGELLRLPLEVVEDSSLGGRRLGVVRLRLTRNPQLFESLAVDDPMFAGVGDLPPELPVQIAAGRVALWLRLSCAEEPALPLGYLGVNAVEVVGQGVRRDAMLGIATGEPDQSLKLPDENIDPESLALEVEEEGAWVRWAEVENLVGQAGDARVFRLDAAAGLLRFGDGLYGRRPPAGHRVRAAIYRYGGGTAGNLPPDSLKQLEGGARLTLRHEWACRGGLDAESVEQAERRIPQHLTHRDRAVTREDFKALCETNPVNPVARAEVLEGFLPGNSIRALREGVPGAVSCFVLPPGAPILAQTPKPTQGLLKDVFSYLIDRVLIGTELYVLSPEFVPLAVGVTLQARDVQTEQQTVRAVRDALVAYLWPVAPGGVQGRGWPLGGSVDALELLTVVARVEGVLSVGKLALFTRGATGWRRLAAGELLTLQRYQLPELLGVSVSTRGGEPSLPTGLPGGPGGAGGAGGAAGGGGRLVPLPVVPDVC